MTDVITKRTTGEIKDGGNDLNREPITGTPGAHPLGTGAGAASGGVAGAAIGVAAGPIGVAVGAVAGGLAGKRAAEAVNPAVEEAYWKAAYVREPYYSSGTSYDFYAAAYRTGWEGRARLEDRNFDEAEADLRDDYERATADNGPNWEDARIATRAAWDRIDQMRGDVQVT